MGKGIAGLETAYRGLFLTVLIVLAVLVILCLVRAIIGPRTADRIVSVNMMGTMVIVMIAILTVMLGEGYLADICIIYAMISFLAVIVLTKVYLGVYLEKKEAGENKAAAGKPEAGGTEAEKAEDGKPEAGGTEAEKAEDGKPEVGGTEAEKAENGKPEVGGTETEKAEGGKTEDRNTEGKRADRQEVLYGDGSRMD